MSTSIAGTQVLRRVSEILRFVAINNDCGTRLTDVVKVLELEQPTAHRLLQGLVAERMLVRDETSKCYRLGSELCELGLMTRAHFGLLDFFDPAMSHIAEVTGDTVVLTIRSGNNGVCVQRCSGAFPIQANSVAVGTRRPLAAGASGLAIMTAMSDVDCDDILSENARRLQSVPDHDIARLRVQIQKARQTGFVLHEMAYATPRLTAVAVPVLGAYGAPIGGLSVRSLASRLAGKHRANVVATLQAGAASISRALTEEIGEAAHAQAMGLALTEP